eukprot:CAMPEP_0173194250 /NCGR_PEP_ID=MMETSP1141-20130122/14409_1 /TAXON_ID=483371 /ORGANISM="non described non described, Strain CCMP2298" /LENGTH=132 /DNA_ID=CAMNT_0014118675 /DNA_START=223 /DNA_END=620 /DNA_ORIENTATION=-
MFTTSAGLAFPPYFPTVGTRATVTSATPSCSLVRLRKTGTHTSLDTPPKSSVPAPALTLTPTAPTPPTSASAPAPAAWGQRGQVFQLQLPHAPLDEVGQMGAPPAELYLHARHISGGQHVRLVANLHGLAAP